MSVFHSFTEINFNPNTVLTVGTFDGVHKGHQLIIKELLKIADNESARALVITIHPHPQVVLKKEYLKPVKLLTTIDERVKLLKEFGVDDILIIPFTKEFSDTKPEDFIVKFLVEKVGLKKILIGYDHLFGKNREGDEYLLYELGKQHNFEISKLGALLERDKTISSTKIRNAILFYDLNNANNMLGYHYFIDGKVVVGDKRGRELGFPTANIEIPDNNKLIPSNGAYLVYSIINNKKYYGMANIGVRPTFNDNNVTTIEVNFFDFTSDIYGYGLSIHFLQFLRFELKFSSVEELVKQLEKDRQNAMQLIKNFSF